MFKKGHNKAAKKKVSAETQARYNRAAAAADKKVGAAELAFATDPSAENQKMLKQARATASTAHKKLEGRAAADAAAATAATEAAVARAISRFFRARF